VQTHYQQIGTGTPLILLHGWGGSWESWHPIITQLSNDFQLIIPDLPAFGKSAEPLTVWDSADYANWLANFIEKTVSEKKYYLAGHSYGGKVAAIFAATAKHLPTKLIIIDASGLPDPLTTQQKLQQQVLSLVPSALKNAIPHTLKQKVLTGLHTSTDHLDSSFYQRQVLRQIVQENIQESLQKISTPTLIIWGEHDESTPLHQGQAFAKYVSKSCFEVIKNTGHFPFIDKTAEFIQILTTYLKK
jgi:pimeloyl-ACP methyl ester carboxylesterase